MGWVCGDMPEHEGFAVGLVDRDGIGPCSGLYRELQYPGDDKPRDDVRMVQAGCECGWRSPRRRKLDARWQPFCLDLHQWDEDALLKLWHEHIEQERARR